MRWPFQTENRASATDAIVTALIAQAGGSSAMHLHRRETWRLLRRRLAYGQEPSPAPR